MIKKAILLVSALSVSFVLAEDNKLTAEEKAEGWELLFDGKSMDQWVNYKKDSISPAWKIDDGAMFKGKKGGDLVTKKSYKDFEFKLDWKISPKGNSGIFIRVDNTGKQIYSKSIEMQILDNATNPKPVHSSGSIYDMIAAPKEAHKPQGEWNHVHIICKGKHMEFHQNGVKIAAFTVGSDEWKKMVGASKFAKWEGFGLAEAGPLGLQEHGNDVWFKNLKVKELK